MFNHSGSIWKVLMLSQQRSNSRMSCIYCHCKFSLDFCSLHSINNWIQWLKPLSKSDKEFQILILCFKYYMSWMRYECWQTNLADDMIMLKICIWGVSSMFLGRNTGYGSQVFVISLHLPEESLWSKPLPFKHFVINPSWIIPILML
jgi:hypothetical protein